MTTDAAANVSTRKALYRWRRLAILSVLAVTVALLIVLGVADGIRISRHVRAGRAAFSRVVHEGLSSDADLTSLARKGVRKFEAARRVADRSPWLSVWARVPVLGRPARWLRAAATTTTVLSREAAESIARLEPRLRSQGPPADRLAFLEVAESEFARLDGVIEAVRLPSTGGFMPPVDAAGRELRADIARLHVALRDGVAAVQGLRSFLRGPSTYAVLAANNAEMRAGGMILQVGLLHSEQGRLSAGGFRSTGDLTLKRRVEVPPQIRALYGWLHPGTEWRNVGSSPNFPTVAPVYAAMAERSGLGAVDGVMQVDVVGVRALLEVSGPVTIAGRSYGARNVERLVMHDLYSAFGGEQVERRHEFSRLAAEAFRALNERSSRPADLVRALRGAAQGRHLLAWSRRPVEQRGWRGLGVDGPMKRDGLMLTVQNHTGNKLDWFLRPSMTLRVEDGPGPFRRLHLRIQILNPTPDGESAYVAGDGKLVRPGDHRALVAVYLPGWASQVRIPGRKIAVVGPDGPSHVIGTRVDIAQGATVTIDVEFSAPPGVHRILLTPSARAPRAVPFRLSGQRVEDSVARWIEF